MELEMHLEKGRPRTRERRLEQEARTYDFLDSLEIEYHRVDHEPAHDMEICKAIDKVLEANICKNLFLCNRQKTAFYLLLMPADKIFKTKELSSQINSARLSFADGDDMSRLIDCTPGSASVLGLVNDKEGEVKLLVDEDILKEEYVGCHPCVNTSSLRIKTKDVFEYIVPATKHDYTVVKLVGVE